MNERTLRELAPRVLAAVARRHARFDLAEDATQEALLAAAQQWPAEGVPDNPYGWLIAVATRRLIDALRAEASRTRREEFAFAQGPPPNVDVPDEDDTLTLLFLCCHPALSPPSQLALMLLTQARSDARESSDGTLIPLAEQDRRRWDRPLLEEGVQLIQETLSRGPLGAYQLQAAIAAVHAEATTAADTDWPQVLKLYDLQDPPTTAGRPERNEDLT